MQLRMSCSPPPASKRQPCDEPVHCTCAALPRPRYDQIMADGWKVCLPISLVNLLGTAAVILWSAPGATA